MMQRLIAEAVAEFVPRQPSRKPFEFSVDVPKDHPGMPRLLEAAKRLPAVRVTRVDGIEMQLRGLSVPGAIDEFFDALACVLGGDYVDEVKERLGVNSEAVEMSPDEMQRALNRVSKLPLLSMLKALGRS